MDMDTEQTGMMWKQKNGRSGKNTGKDYVMQLIMQYPTAGCILLLLLR